MKAQERLIQHHSCSRGAHELVTPYGGTLTQSLCDSSVLAERLGYLSSLPRIALTTDGFRETLMLATGAYSPLSGFMDQASYQSVLSGARLPSGLPWGLPVTLGVSELDLGAVGEANEVALYYQNEPVALLRTNDVYPWDIASEAASLLGIDDAGHPAIVALRRRGHSHIIGGDVELIIDADSALLENERLWPTNAREFFEERGWTRVTAVHADNLWQRTHEYLLKSALETADALLLHSGLEEDTRTGVLPGKIISKARDILLRNFFPRDRMLWTHMTGTGWANGSRIMLQQAIISQNYGCDSIIYLQDATSKANQHSEVDALSLWGDTEPAIRPIVLEAAFHCESCGGVATEKSCPHGTEQRTVISEDSIFEKLIAGEHLPTHAVRHEVARQLSRDVSSEYAGKVVKQGRHIFPHAAEVSREFRQTAAGHRAGVLWMTGLSGSGKSTVAHRVERDLLLSGHRVFVLDGDTLRDGLCSDLAFTREDRRENLRRAAEVAKVMMEAGMLVIASFISPYKQERAMVREIVGDSFFEVYVEANLETCEERDPKGLYSRARAGIIPEFTGISSPYEAPEDPELRVNTTIHSAEESARHLIEHMAKAGLLRSTRVGALSTDHANTIRYITQ